MKKIKDNVFEIEMEGEMKVPARIFSSDKLIEAIKQDKALEQIKNVAKLPGIIKNALIMPDAHQGYGFPIGGVAAFDLENGIVSPGGVGYDINCGVRVLITNISVKDFLSKREVVLNQIQRSIPSGVGRGSREKLTMEDLDKYLIGGVEYALEQGFGEKEDLYSCEENGKMQGADPKDVSERAKYRGAKQLGTLGAGNHFIEIQQIKEIFDKDVAKKFNLKKDNICVMIHCGSRGLGHQVASDYIKLMEKGNQILPDRELVYAKIKSGLGKKYFSAMNCAINFAFANRQIIMHKIREELKKIFPNLESSLLYDVCHNIAKVESHKIDGEVRKVCIHRKGATRAFGPNRDEVPKKYRSVGQPVIIPGSMGTSSYVLVGTEKSEELSFSSTAHGAGRVMSRSKAIQTLNSEKVLEDLENKNISVTTLNRKGIVEEAPEVYKDIDEVINVSDSLGIAKKVVKLIPLAVLKG